MKKVLLTAMAILTVASASAFGMYGDNADWIDFLTDGNMLKARMDTLGFTLGNGTIKGTFGFKNAGGSILSTSSVTPVDDKGTPQETKRFYNFNPTLSVGIGYTTEAFGIGLGYNYRYVAANKLIGQEFMTGVKLESLTTRKVGLSVHTPVLTFNAMNNRLKIVVPIQVAVKNGNYDDEVNGIPYKTEEISYLGLSMDPQIRFYPGLDFLTEFRLQVKYGMNKISQKDMTAEFKKLATVSSFGFDFRTYFAAQVGDIALSPFIKITYDTALDAKGRSFANVSYDKLWGITAGNGFIFNPEDPAGYNSNPWKLVVLPTLGLSASSDTVSVYGEVGLGYKAVNTGRDYDKLNVTTTGILHSLAWRAYGEVKVTPIKDLEWYMEMEIGNDTAGTGRTVVGDGSFDFAAGTGLTWYLPSLNGAE